MKMSQIIKWSCNSISNSGRPFAIHETNLRPLNNFKIYGYTTVGKDHINTLRAPGRVAIMVKAP